MGRLVVLIAVTLAIPCPAHAQAPGERLPPSSHLKSATTATTISLAVTAAGGLMIAGGVIRDNPTLAGVGLVPAIIGPSAGHIYAGEAGHPIKMSLLRGLAAGVFVLAAIDAGDSKSYCETESNFPGTDCKTDSFDKTLMVVGGVTFAAASLYDFWDASRAARRTNTRLMMMPTMLRGVGGQSVPAVGMTGSF